MQAFGTLAADAANHREAAVRAFATGLRDEVIHKTRSLEDAAANLKSFKIERRWTEALEDLLKKVVEPGAPAGHSGRKAVELKVSVRRATIKSSSPAPGLRSRMSGSFLTYRCS